MSHHRPWPYARVLAHRGGGTLAPENTIAAIALGLRHGYRAVEFDAMLAADDVAVLMHDETLARTTSGGGAVAATASAVLAQLDAGSWHSAAFQDEPVPLLDAALRYCRQHGVWINLEIKPVRGFEARTGQIVARSTAARYADLLHPGGDRAASVDARVPLLSSFARAALVAARAAAPNLPRGYLRDRVPPDWQHELQSLGCVSLHTNHRHLRRPQARAIKDAGYWLFCYTVNDEQRARELLAWGVDAFCTDRIDLIAPSMWPGGNPLDASQASV